jgi:hypothetical protein
MQNAGPFSSHPKLTYQCPLTRQPLTVESANNLPDLLRDLTNNKATDFLVTLVTLPSIQ